MKFLADLQGISRNIIFICTKIVGMKNTKPLEIWLWFVSRLDATYAHLLSHYLLYIALILGYATFASRYEFSVNVSVSLPGTLYLVEKGTLPTRDEYASFYYPSDFIYPKGTRFLKRVVGIPGDVVQSKSHHFFVNGKPVGVAMSTTSAGKHIQENDFEGVIPAGHYYVMGEHPLSLDSRYKVVGLLSNQAMVGRGFRLF